MLKLKQLNLLSLILCFTSVSFAAKAAPVTYTGSKGQYTVDLNAGTYEGCVYKQSCILLGPNEKVGPSTWKNGDYTYSVSGSVVHIYQKSKEIFQDKFISTSTQKPKAPDKQATTSSKPATATSSNSAYGLITKNSIGSAQLGMTFGELKAKLGKSVTYKSSPFMVDYDGVAVIKSGEVLYYILFPRGEKLLDRNKITILVTDNINYQTKEGVGPGTSLTDAQKIYGKAKLSYNHENESREAVDFSQLPKSYRTLWFRPKSKGFDFAGIYPKSNSSQNETTKIRPNAVIWYIFITDRTI
jgi:hypothetical protein